MPRYKRALDQLVYYQDRARFRFLPRTDRRSARILWRAADGSQIQVCSPLARYLREQRRSTDADGEWDPRMGQIFAKDYAILARFADRASGVLTSDGLFHDYFIAGIRGLGTWGAAWYIDRKYKYLQGYEEYADIQLLLEVQFSKNFIYDVVDVSDKPAEYFAKENELATVRKLIQQHHQ
jgi:hypothetical protein